MKKYIRTETGELIDIEFFGVSTWGSSNQDSIKYRNGNYYMCNWQAGNEHFDDTTSECKINVIKESDNIEDIVDKVVEENGVKCAYINGRKVACITDFGKNDMFGRGISWEVFE